jgi:hypothetical protein
MRMQICRTALVALLAGTLACDGDPASTALQGNDASLRSLALSIGSLSPGFSSEVTSYTTGVNNATGSITVSAIPRDSDANITINGVPRGNPATSNIGLAVGANTVNIVVTAENGVTSRNYVIVITRASPIGA